jgi:hypothetical protein
VTIVALKNYHLKIKCQSEQFAMRPTIFLFILIGACRGKNNSRCLKIIHAFYYAAQQSKPINSIAARVQEVLASPMADPSANLITAPLHGMSVDWEKLPNALIKNDPSFNTTTTTTSSTATTNASSTQMSTDSPQTSTTPATIVRRTLLSRSLGLVTCVGRSLLGFKIRGLLSNCATVAFSA